MSTLEVKKNYSDEAVYKYLETHDVYSHQELGIDVAAVVKYATENSISLKEVPEEIILKYSFSGSESA